MLKVDSFFKMLFVSGCEFVRMNESSWVKWVVQTSHLLHRSLLKERYKRISSRYVNVNLQGRDTKKKRSTSRLGQNGSEKARRETGSARLRLHLRRNSLNSAFYFLCTLTRFPTQKNLRLRPDRQFDRQTDGWWLSDVLLGGKKHVAWPSVLLPRSPWAVELNFPDSFGEYLCESDGSENTHTYTYIYTKCRCQEHRELWNWEMTNTQIHKYDHY